MPDWRERGQENLAGEYQGGGSIKFSLIFCLLFVSRQKVRIG